ncbi:hypothetical protein EJB05_12659, partial [Eragrostis curvula]
MALRQCGTGLISALPDDLIFEFLIRLRCARAAVRTSLLSRRWRLLCNRLPELRFRDIAPDHLDAALASVATAGRVLSLLEIHVSDLHPLQSHRISSLLHAAARLAPAVLNVCILGLEGKWSGAMADAVELPCVRRATSLKLEVTGVRFTLPPAGDFPALESISLVLCCHIDLADLVPRCPRLRKLRISSLMLFSVIVHSPLLEELDVVAHGPVRRIYISAPSLKKLQLKALGGLDNEFSLSFSAPLLEKLQWMWCCSSSQSVGFGQIWRLTLLNMNIPKMTNGSESGSTDLQPPRHLLLNIEPSVILTDAVKSIEGQLSRFLVTSFSFLDLMIGKANHVYGPLVLRLLGANTSIQRLRVKICGVREEACSANCPCDHTNWRSQRISLTNLKKVEIEGFAGESHEVDLLKVILRSAAMLQTVSLRLSRKVSSNTNGCMEEVSQLSKVYPSVILNIYHRSGYQ